MTVFQRVIKYLAMAFAIFLTVSIIGGVIGMLGLFGGLFQGDRATGGLETYAVSQEIRRLEVTVNAADFAIKQGERFSVESNLKNLTVEERDGVLSIREASKWGVTYNDAVLTLYLPADAAFEKISLETGAGRLTAERLAAEQVELDFGAGEATIQSLTAATRAEISGGAGKVTVASGALHDLDLDMGVGKLELTAALTGDCAFELGIGQSNITVLGSRGDYRLDMEKGLGSMTVDGVSVSDFKEQGLSENTISVSGGIGAVFLKFAEKAVDFS